MSAHRQRQAIPVIARTDSTYPNSRAHRLVYESDGTGDFTEADWLDCALACLDQAGLTVEQQRWHETMLRASFERRGVRS